MRRISARPASVSAPRSRLGATVQHWLTTRSILPSATSSAKRWSDVGAGRPSPPRTVIRGSAAGPGAGAGAGATEVVLGGAAAGELGAAVTVTTGVEITVDTDGTLEVVGGLAIWEFEDAHPAVVKSSAAMAIPARS